MRNLVDRVAGFLGAWAIRRLFDPSCEQFSSNCCDCRAAEVMKVMECGNR